MKHVRHETASSYDICTSLVNWGSNPGKANAYPELPKNIQKKPTDIPVFFIMK